jgi:cytochrome P450
MGTTTDVYYDPYDFEIDTHPYAIWKRLRDEAPLYYNERYDFYAVSRFADVESMSKDWKLYSSRNGTTVEMIRADIRLPEGMFISEDPPGHEMHRNILSRAVTPRRVAALDGRIRELCAEYLDPFVGSSGFDLATEFATNLPMRVIGALVGIPDEYLIDIRNQTHESARLQSGEAPEQVSLSGITDPYGPFLAYRRKNPADDFLTTLIDAEFTDVTTGKERHLSDEEILTYVGMLNAAGNETTARLIAWLGKILAEYSQERAKIVADPALAGSAVEEALRFESPSPIQARTVMRDVEVHGQVVPEGSVMALLTGAANRDDRRFEDAENYVADRTSDHHLAFGYGIHYCFGAALARIEGRIALQELLKRFPTWDVDLSGAEMIHTTTIRGYLKLPIVL